MVFSRLCGILLFQDLLGSYGRGIRIAYPSLNVPKKPTSVGSLDACSTTDSSGGRLRAHL